MTSSLLKRIVACAILALVSACGGSGESESTGAEQLTLAWFTVTPAAGVVPHTVQLDASGSVGRRGSIVGYKWSLGDGTPVVSGVIISHTYQSTGTFTVTLWVSNSSGETASTTRQVTVRALPPTLALAANPTNVASGDVSTLTWNTTDAATCAATGGWSGDRPTSGSETTAPTDQTTAYTLTCTGPGGEVTQTVTVAVNAVGGNLLVSSISRSDNDINDPAANFVSNDLPSEAQSLPSPVVVGGYLNEPGRGPTGRSFAAGDLDDFYAVNLVAGQVIEMVLPSADPALPDDERDDADLYLYDSNLVLVDSSIDIGQVEQLSVPADGLYYVNVYLYSGAPLYRLSIGQSSITSSSASLKLTDDFVPGEVIVTLKAKASSADARQKASMSLESAYGLRRKAGDPAREMLLAVPANAADIVGRQKPTGVEPLPTGLVVPASLQRKLETLKYVKLLQTNPAVLAAAPNRIVRATAVPNDPGYAIQRWHYEQIELPAAWNITQGSANVVVAIVDTGVVMAHPDLAGKLVDGFDFVSSAQNQDGTGLDSNPDDPGCALGGGSVFHGTHVAGTVAAATNNGSGVAGVAWNVHLMPIRVLDGCTGGGTFYDVGQGIRYAAGLSNDAERLPSKRADVINLSLSSSGSCDQTSANLFAEVRGQGVVVVASAGNQNSSASRSPASCPNVISVSAVGPTAQRAPYSNYGATVDVAAPGGDMTLDANGDGRSDGVYSTHAAGGGTNRLPNYDLFQGTSMASPHVAGVIGLMKSVKPGLTPAEVDMLLAQGLLTNDIGPEGRDDLGVGLISALKAVQAAGGSAPSLPASLAVTPTSLNFGDVGTLARVDLSNSGTEPLSITGTTASATWLRAAPATINANGLGAYTISVVRGALPPGGYSGWVDFASTAGIKRVFVLMQVATATSAEPDAGWQYVLLADPNTGDTVGQTEVAARGSSIPYRFGSVSTGDYWILAGTDMNNNQYICDDGEACGVYPVESSPVIVSVEGERLGIDFSSTFQTGIQAAAASKAGQKPQGFARRQP